MYSTIALFETAVQSLKLACSDEMRSLERDPSRIDRLVTLRFRQAETAFRAACADMGIERSAFAYRRDNTSQHRLNAAFQVMEECRARHLPSDSAEANSGRDIVPSRDPLAEWVQEIRPKSPSVLLYFATQARRVFFSHVSLLDPIVKKFGKWGSDREVGLFEPVLVLLDGIEGEDPLSNGLMKLCSARNRAVASLDIASIKSKAERISIYKILDRLRSTTPLAISHVVLTVDSGLSSARHLVNELQELGGETHKAQIEKNTEIGNDEGSNDSIIYFLTVGMEVGALKNLATDPIGRRTAANANRVVAALGAVTLARNAEESLSRDEMEESALVCTQGADVQVEQVKAVVSSFRGAVFCMDVSRSDAIETQLERNDVRYIYDAVNHGDLWSAALE